MFWFLTFLSINKRPKINLKKPKTGKPDNEIEKIFKKSLQITMFQDFRRKFSASSPLLYNSAWNPVA